MDFHYEDFGFSHPNTEKLKIEYRELLKFRKKMHIILLSILLIGFPGFIAYQYLNYEVTEDLISEAIVQCEITMTGRCPEIAVIYHTPERSGILQFTVIFTEQSDFNDLLYFVSINRMTALSQETISYFGIYPEDVSHSVRISSNDLYLIRIESQSVNLNQTVNDVEFKLSIIETVLPFYEEYFTIILVSTIFGISTYLLIIMRLNHKVKVYKEILKID
jgi:hypothetical protein